MIKKQTSIPSISPYDKHGHSFLPKGFHFTPEGMQKNVPNQKYPTKPINPKYQLKKTPKGRLNQSAKKFFQ